MKDRLKYDLEGKVDEIASKRLVHVMFDCNRLWWKNKPPKNDGKTLESMWSEKAQYVYGYSCFSGKPVKAIDGNKSYVKHLRN